MAQLNFYVPDDMEDLIRKSAKQHGQSISAFLATLVKEHCVSAKEWPPHFFETTVGGWQGDFPDREDSQPQEREWLE